MLNYIRFGDLFTVPMDINQIKLIESKKKTCEARLNNGIWAHVRPDVKVVFRDIINKRSVLVVITNTELHDNISSISQDTAAKINMDLSSLSESSNILVADFALFEEY